MNILLAVDPEGLAESVVPIAAALAREASGHVVAVIVCAADDPPERREAGRQRFSRVLDVRETVPWGDPPYIESEDGWCRIWPGGSARKTATPVAG